VPCGISAHGVTSVNALTGARPDVREEAARALGLLAERLGRTAGELDDQSSSALSSSRLVAARPQ
jgi:hypothetical protein